MRFRHFFDGQAGEELQLDKVALLRVEGREIFECAIERKNVRIRRSGRRFGARWRLPRCRAVSGTDFGFAISGSRRVDLLMWFYSADRGIWQAATAPNGQPLSEDRTDRCCKSLMQEGFAGRQGFEPR